MIGSVAGWDSCCWAPTSPSRFSAIWRKVSGVSASGNNDYDPNIEDSGFGGTSQGDYELRLTFRKDADESIVDATGVALDGDADGNPGGVNNFWFRAATPADFTTADEPRVIYVDKATGGVQVGTLADPFRNIDDALAAADEGDIVRIVGNGGADGDISTVEDNLAYQVGFSRFQVISIKGSKTGTS